MIKFLIKNLTEVVLLESNTHVQNFQYTWPFNYHDQQLGAFFFFFFWTLDNSDYFVKTVIEILLFNFSVFGLLVKWRYSCVIATYICYFVSCLFFYWSFVWRRYLFMEDIYYLLCQVVFFSLWHFIYLPQFTFM